MGGASPTRTARPNLFDDYAVARRIRGACALAELTTRVQRLAGRCPCDQVGCAGMLFHVIIATRHDAAPWPAEAPARAHAVIQAVCSYAAVPMDSLERGQTLDVKRTRALACHFLREHGYTVSQIGRWLGIHHTTVSQAIKRVRTNPDAAALAEITTRLQSEIGVDRCTP